jgi:O-antigen ligase
LFGAAVAGGVVGALITGSRTGCALLVPALLAGVAIFFGGQRDRRRARMIVLATAGGLLVVVLAGVILATVQPGGALGLLLSRSYTGDDDRYMFWPVVIRMIPKYMPWGIGFGSFRRAFEIDEPANLLAPLYLNHAHNDWFEITLEAGVAGIVLAAGFVIWLLWRWVPAWRSRTADPLRQAAGTVIALLLAHSCFDYPIRTVALSTCFAASIALLSRPAAGRPRPVRTAS